MVVNGRRCKTSLLCVRKQRGEIRSNQIRLEPDHASPKMVWLFSMRNCTAIFLECMSVISFSRLWSLIMVGAKTTARFFGDIYVVDLVRHSTLPHRKGATYQVLSLSAGHPRKVEHEEL